MSRINFILLMAVLVSGLYMVRNAYEARRLFTELDRAQTEARRLDADYQRLQAERHAQATNLRVEQVARERLHMRAITPAITQTVTQTVTQAAAQGDGQAALSGRPQASEAGSAARTASAAPGGQP